MKTFEFQEHIFSWDPNLCGAVLIDERVAISAAHCFWSPYGYGLTTSKEEVEVVAGAYHSEDKVERRNIKNFWTPFEGIWNPKNHPDIVILELDHPFSLNHNISPACLPSTETMNGEVKSIGSKKKGDCYVSGWGKTGDYAEGSTYLKTAPVKVVDNYFCQSTNVRVQIPEEFFVCGSNSMGTGCSGDSGQTWA